MEKQQFEKFWRKATQLLLEKSNNKEIELTHGEIYSLNFVGGEIDGKSFWQANETVLKKLSPEVMEEIRILFQQISHP